ncbi:MAG: YqzL-like protein [Clostridia bacterium]|nr:YqzL-like protein [Clostridia bacterium]
MNIVGSEAYWQLFSLTGNIEAYLLYRDVLREENNLIASEGQN